MLTASYIIPTKAPVTDLDSIPSILSRPDWVSDTSRSTTGDYLAFDRTIVEEDTKDLALFGVQALHQLDELPLSAPPLSVFALSDQLHDLALVAAAFTGQ